RTRPGAFHEIARRCAPLRHRLRHRHRVDENEERLGFRPPLQLEDAADRSDVERGDGEPVEGFGRKRQHAAGAERVRGGAQRGSSGRDRIDGEAATAVWTRHVPGFGGPPDFICAATLRARSSTSSARRLRYAAIRAASAGSPTARIWAASRPALAAPHFPIATVATGTPLGICTIDSSASRPPSGVAATGTPITGSGELAASTPRSPAAPPAPAIRTPIPRACAVDAYSWVRSGVR